MAIICPGVISDAAKNTFKLPRSYCLVLVSTGIFLSQVTAAHVDEISNLWFASAILGLSYGSVFSLFPQVCIEWFGLREYPHGFHFFPTLRSPLPIFFTSIFVLVIYTQSFRDTGRSASPRLYLCLQHRSFHWILRVILIITSSHPFWENIHSSLLRKLGILVDVTHGCWEHFHGVLRTQPRRSRIEIPLTETDDQASGTCLRRSSLLNVFHHRYRHEKCRGEIVYDTRYTTMPGGKGMLRCSVVSDNHGDVCVYTAEHLGSVEGPAEVAAGVWWH